MSVSLAGRARMTARGHWQLAAVGAGVLAVTLAVLGARADPGSGLDARPSEPGSGDQRAARRDRACDRRHGRQGRGDGVRRDHPRAVRADREVHQHAAARLAGGGARLCASRVACGGDRADGSGDGGRRARCGRDDLDREVLGGRAGGQRRLGARGAGADRRRGVAAADLAVGVSHGGRARERRQHRSAGFGERDEVQREPARGRCRRRRRAWAFWGWGCS